MCCHEVASNSSVKTEMIMFLHERFLVVMIIYRDNNIRYKRFSQYQLLWHLYCEFTVILLYRNTK